jgi:hypothetical protein
MRLRGAIFGNVLVLLGRWLIPTKQDVIFLRRADILVSPEIFLK